MIGTAQAYTNFRPAHNPRDHLNVVMVQLVVIIKDDDPKSGERLRQGINNVVCTRKGVTIEGVQISSEKYYK